MNPSVHFPSSLGMDKRPGQTGFFSLGKATRFGDAKLNSNESYPTWKLTLYHILFVIEGLGKYIHCLKIDLVSYPICGWGIG